MFGGAFWDLWSCIDWSIPPRPLETFWVGPSPPLITFQIHSLIFLLKPLGTWCTFASLSIAQSFLFILGEIPIWNRWIQYGFYSEGNSRQTHPGVLVDPALSSVSRFLVDDASVYFCRIINSIHFPFHILSRPPRSLVVQARTAALAGWMAGWLFTIPPMKVC